jgi:hypothetical protein
LSNPEPDHSYFDYIFTFSELLAVLKEEALPFNVIIRESGPLYPVTQTWFVEQFITQMVKLRNCPKDTDWGKKVNEHTDYVVWVRIEDIVSISIMETHVTELNKLSEENNES